MAETAERVAAVRSTVTVPIQRADAFRLFTEGMGSWWPYAGHSIYQAETTGVVVEPMVGGRVYETTGDGREGDWGRITAWEPGRRVAMTWHPGQSPGEATALDVTFSDTPDGGTLVELVHDGWEARGADAARMRANYQEGWPIVLGRFVAAA